MCGRCSCQLSVVNSQPSALSYTGLYDGTGKKRIESRMQDFKNLAVWKKSHTLTVDVYGMTRSLPKDEMYGLMSQLKRACVSIEANLAEGCGRGSDADFGRFVQIAMGSASEVECHLLISHDLNLLDVTQYQELNFRVVEVKRMLAALLKRLHLYKSMS